MCVSCQGVGSMRYLHHPAISTTTSDEAHASGRRCFYRRTACRSKVDAGVHAHIAVDWVCATAKDGTQPRSFHRLREHAQHFSVDIDRRLTAAVVRPDDLVDRSTKIQLSEGKLRLTNPLVPVSGLAPKEAHRLAPRKITTEIHGATQHLRQVHRKPGGDVCRVQGSENRALDHRLAGESHQFGVRLQHASGKLFAEDRLYPDTVFDGEFYTTRVVVRCGNHGNDVTRTQTAQIVFRA